MKVAREQMLLYAVTDRMWLNGRRLPEEVDACVRAGVTMVQLREKDCGSEEFLALAKELGAICKKHGVPFIINDDVEVALACGADGVHVGQSDMEAGKVRERLGEGKIIGVSAQTVEQALLAERSGADYLGVGAVFCTSTKLDASEVGFRTLRDICAAVSIPVVAIGGIGRDNLPALKGSGIAGVAVVSALFAQPDIAAATTELLAVTREVVAG